MTEDGASLLAMLFGDLTCKKVFSCNRDLDSHGGIGLWFLLMLYMFKALGTICDEYFVPSLEVIVEKLQVSNDVAGATFMAAGSSAPELFTSLVATFLIVNAGGIGTIIGSAIFNILVMTGVTAYVACGDQQLKIWWYPLFRDSCFYSLAILELLLVLLDEEVHWYEGLGMILTYVLYCVYMKYNPNIVSFCGLQPKPDNQDRTTHAAPSDGDWWEPGKEAGLNVTAKVMPEATQEPAAQTVGQTQDHLCPHNLEDNANRRKSWSYRGSVASNRSVRWSMRRSMTSTSTGNRSNRSSAATMHSEVSGHSTSATPSMVARHGSASGRVAPVQEGGQESASSTGGSEDPQDPGTNEPALEPGSEGEEERSSWCRDPLSVFWELTLPTPDRWHGFALFTGSIAWIGFCTYIMVDSTHRMGVIMRVPSFVMGLIFLAAGTSIPDTLGSIAVAKQGEGDMAIANALGSNVFDILIGLGVPWTVRACYQEVLFKDQFDDLIGDIVILAAVLVLFVSVLAMNNWMLNRRLGLILIILYIIFVTYQLLAVFVVESKTLPAD